jgi:hypothetical protein
MPSVKEDAMELIDGLIARDKGSDIFRGQPRKGWSLLPKGFAQGVGSPGSWSFA